MCHYTDKKQSLILTGPDQSKSKWAVCLNVLHCFVVFVLHTNEVTGTLDSLAITTPLTM